MWNGGLQIFIFLLCTCLACTIGCGFWEFLVGHRFQIYLPWEHFIPGSSMHSGRVDKSVTVGSTVTSVLVLLSYAIVLNTVVPISLYVRLMYYINILNKREHTVVH